MNKIPDCPVCGEGFLSNVSEGVERDDDGYKEVIPLLYSLCSECESAVGLEEQVNANARAMGDFYARADVYHKNKNV